jgi:CHAD domain-containing protein
MSKSRKWEISGLSKKQTLSSALKRIFNTRIKTLLRSIEKYFETGSVEALHEVRIGLRRVRYSLELFFCCIEKNVFLKFYKNIEDLQDLSGLVRDIDIMKINIASISSDKNIDIPASITEELESRRKNLEDNLRLKLMKFTRSKTLKEFNKLLE